MIPLEVIALSPYAREWAAAQARRSARRRFRDHLGRPIELGEVEPGDWDALLAMYQTFDGTTTLPFNLERRAVWLDQLMSRGPNAIARTSGRIVGHAAFVSRRDGESPELVVLVRRDYRGAGIEAALANALLRPAARLPKPPRPTNGVAPAIVRLRALAQALRFAMIPLVCAIVIALASQDARGRMLAIILALASIAFGLVVHGRELVFGRLERGRAHW